MEIKTKETGEMKMAQERNHGFRQIEDLRTLNGWLKNRIVVAEAAPLGRILFVTQVKGTRRSQPRVAMPQGFVLLANEKRLDIANRRVDDKDVALFEWHPRLQLHWERQQALEHLEAWLESTSNLADVNAFGHVMFERLRDSSFDFSEFLKMPVPFQVVGLRMARSRILDRLPALALNDLQQLASRFAAAPALPTAV